MCLSEFRRQTGHMLVPSQNKFWRGHYRLLTRVEVHNHKDEAVVVELGEKIRGDWRVVKESYNREKVDSSTLVHKLSLGKSEKQTLTYSVRLRW